MRGEKIVLLILALVILGLAFLNPSGLRKTGDFLTFGFSTVNKISAEDMNSKFEASCAVLPEVKGKFVGGNIFSRYPMNLKDRLLVDVGSADGVKFGGAAVSDGILIGKVVGVSADTSIVQTVFDSNFSLAVRIGKLRGDALLKGGVEPRLTLIPKASSLAAGDAVFSASEDFQYGLPLGVVGVVSLTAQNVFSEASLILSYSPADLRYLFLEKQ
jgi:cell shape-determining protein MreC